MAAVDINWIAVLVAAAIAFVLGALWYGPLFGDAWMRSMGWDPAEVRSQPRKNLRQVLTMVFLLEWVMAMCLAFFIGNAPDGMTGALYGFLAGLPWVAFALAVNGLFERKQVSYICINGAYWTVVFTLMGFVIGAFM